MYLQTALLATVGILTTSVQAADDSAAREFNSRLCVEARDLTAPAVTTKDWSEIKIQAQRILEACKDVDSYDARARAYWDIATANRELGNHKDALSAADACIGIFVAIPRCQIERARALIVLERRDEAKESLLYALRIAQFNIDSYGVDVIGGSAKQERGEAQWYQAQSDFGLANDLLAKHFPD